MSLTVELVDSERSVWVDEVDSSAEAEAKVTEYRNDVADGTLRPGEGPVIRVVRHDDESCECEELDVSAGCEVVSTHAVD